MLACLLAGLEEGVRSGEIIEPHSVNRVLNPLCLASSPRVRLGVKEHGVKYDQLLLIPWLQCLREISIDIVGDNNSSSIKQN